MRAREARDGGGPPPRQGNGRSRRRGDRAGREEPGGCARRRDRRATGSSRGAGAASVVISNAIAFRAPFRIRGPRNAGPVSGAAARPHAAAARLALAINACLRPSLAADTVPTAPERPPHQVRGLTRDNGCCRASNFRTCATVAPAASYPRASATESPGRTRRPGQARRAPAARPRRTRRAPGLCLFMAPFCETSGRLAPPI